MRIWKFTLNLQDRQTIQVPKGAQLLTVQLQFELPQLWALVDENTPASGCEWLSIAIYGTGNPMPHSPGRYLATFQQAGGAIVWHAFVLGASHEHP